MWVYLVASCRDWSRLCSSHLASRIGRDRTRLYQCNEYRHRVVPLRQGPPDAVDAVGDRPANQRTRRYNSYAEYALMQRCVTGRTDGTVGSLAVGWAMQPSAGRVLLRARC